MLVLLLVLRVSTIGSPIISTLSHSSLPLIKQMMLLPLLAVMIMVMMRLMIMTRVSKPVGDHQKVHLLDSECLEYSSRIASSIQNDALLE
jgi:hypothetical protein